jgi:hypothetical protein
MSTTLNFSATEIEIAKGADCNIVHDPVSDTWNYDPVHNITWSEIGISEQILKRKLVKCE